MALAKLYIMPSSLLISMMSYICFMFGGILMFACAFGTCLEV